MGGRPGRGGPAAIAAPWRLSLPRSWLRAAGRRSAPPCRLCPVLSGWDRVARVMGPVVLPCGVVADGTVAAHLSAVRGKLRAALGPYDPFGSEDGPSS